uniref:Tf2-1-like SH3-like domain-containing protein n=1 Tax=Nicotiana tabacum TaxID=4097 RepID=A0A1S3ZBE9_TOBAC|nr:PREDICTED: uncharacterized protein LOC107785017 [Nicotiana tabacum]
MVGEKVLLRVLPMKDVLRFVKKGKFSPRYIGPFEVLERIGQVSYKLALPPSLSGVHPVFYISMSQKYYGDLSHVLDFSTSLDTSKTGEYVPSGEASKGNSMQAQPEVQSHQIPKQFPRRFHLVDESSSSVGSSKGSEDFEPSSSHAPTTLINIEYDDKVPDDGRWGDIIVGGMARLWKPKEWVDRFLSEKAFDEQVLHRYVRFEEVEARQYLEKLALGEAVRPWLAEILAILGTTPVWLTPGVPIVRATLNFEAKGWQTLTILRVSQTLSTLNNWMQIATIKLTVISSAVVAKPPSPAAF